jgi:hypothetical protein
LFDSLILLSVGGQVVYHGPTEGAEPYFGDLEYKLPKGESVADWLIDISSGRLEPSNTISLKRAQKQIEISEEKDGEFPTDQRSSVASFRPEEIENAVQKFQASRRVITDGNCIGKKGVTTGKVFRYVYFE